MCLCTLTIALISINQNLQAQGTIPDCHTCDTTSTGGSSGGSSSSGGPGATLLSFGHSGVKTFPSPTAASVAKVQEMSIDQFNGANSLSFPLYEFSFYGLTVPISLHYNSSGLRVQERAGWVGLGWSLKAGGSITRVVRHLPDDSFEGFEKYENEILTFTPDETNPDSADKAMYDAILDGDKDSEPDKFIISMPGFSGEMFHMEGNYRLYANNRKLKITPIRLGGSPPTNDKIISWEIIDESGIKYTFSELEYTFTTISTVVNDQVSSGSNKTVVTAWHLTKIEHPQHSQHIILEYDQGSYGSVQSTFTEGQQVITDADVRCSGEDNFIMSQSTINNNSVYLKKIKLSSNNNYYVEFFTQSRTDLTSARALDYIDIKMDGDDYPVNINFNYNYFTGTGGHQRLKLLDVTMDAGFSNQAPLYKFDYVGGAVPSYDHVNQKYAADHWGYYNGETTNTTTIPDHLYFGGSLLYPNGANREPAAWAAQIAMLNKITYQSGGYASFTYEGNTYGKVGSASPLSSSKNGGGVRVKSITYHDGMSTANNIVKTFTYNKSNGLSSGVIAQEPYYLKSGQLVIYHADTGTNPSCDYQEILPTGFYTLGEYTGNRMGYTEVTEEYSSGAAHGKIVHYFEIEPSVWRGDKTKSRYFDSTGSEQKKNLFTHSFSSTTNSNRGFEAERTINSYQLSGVTEYDTVYVPKPYTIEQYTTYLTSEKERIYNGESDSVQNAKTYTYASSVNLINSITETGDNTGTRSTSYTYASSKYSGMSSSHMHSQIYAVSGTNGKQWTIWGTDVNGKTGTWMPKQQWVWKGTGTAPADPATSNSIKTSEITEYDSYGNVIKAEDNDGVEVKYYYGNNTSPFSTNNLNGLNGIFLTGIQQSQNGLDSGSACSGDDLCTSATYDDFGRVLSIKDENDDTVSYTYDALGRLNTQSNSQGKVITEYEYEYSSELNAGVFDSDEPNKVVSNTFTSGPGFIEPTSAAGVSKWDDVTYDHVFDGERTMRVGFNGGGWDGFAEYTTFTKGVAKADFYIGPDVSSGSAIVFYIRSSDGNDIFALRYNTAVSNFQAWSKKNGSWTSAVSIGLTAQKGKWYTVEFVRGDNQTQADMFVYPKGEQRNYTTKYTGTGFPSDWTTHVQSSGGLSGGTNDYYYVANISAGERIQAVTYSDGLGREIQSQSRGGEKVIASETLYNNRGLPQVVSRPIEKTAAQYPGYYDQGMLGGSSFTPSVNGEPLPTTSDVFDYYDDILPSTSNEEQFAYSQTVYENSPLARVKKASLPGIAQQMGSNNELENSYTLNTHSSEVFAINGASWGVGTLVKTISEDPDGIKTITYSDAWGQTIVSGVDMNGNGRLEGTTKTSCTDPTPPALPTCDLITEFDYDTRGNLIRVEDPRNLATTYTYNTLGQLTEKNLPDQTHAHQYRYDDKGRLRFHRDPVLNGSTDRYYYTKYDDLDRPTDIGKRNTSADFDDEADINDQDFPYFSYTMYIRHSYDGTNAATSAQNLEGRLTRIQYRDLSNTSNWGYTWYSYNDLGLVEWIKQRLPGQSSSLDKTIYYTYDELGRTTRVFFDSQTSGEDFYFWYKYDELGRLQYVLSNENSNEDSAVREAEYIYYADSQVKQLKLGPEGNLAQTVDYTYTVQGWLDQINGGSVSTGTGGDRFSIDLDYKNSGNVEKQVWKQSAISTSPATYHYSYDNANRITTACYGVANCNSTNYANYDVAYEYDRNGNLDKIERFPNSTSSDLINHVYVNNTNKLLTVVMNGPNYDLSHDANGNVTQNDLQDITSIAYNWRNLPNNITTGSGTLKFAYDGDGNRVKKELVGQSTQWYVRGAAGEVIAVYEGSTLSYWVLPGGLGIINY